MSSSTDAAFAGFAAHKSGDALPFYEIEGQILELWDQLNELRLEKALLEAQDTIPIGTTSGLNPKALANTNLTRAATISRGRSGCAGEACGERVPRG